MYRVYETITNLTDRLIPHTAQPYTCRFFPDDSCAARRYGKQNRTMGLRFQAALEKLY